MKREGGVPALERVEAILRNPAVYELGNIVPEVDQSRGGRRRLYPAFMLVVYEALITVYGSARQVEAELAHPVVWSLIRRIVGETLGSDPDRVLPAEPMRRHHYLYGRTRYLADPEVLDQLLDGASDASQLSSAGWSG